MASEADKAEQRVQAQRRLIEQKLARLEARARDDLSRARTTARDRANEVTHGIPGTQRIGQQVEQRPLSAMAAGLAAGIGLGMLSESVSLRGNGSSLSGGRGHEARRYEEPSPGDRHDRGAAKMSWLTGPATAVILGPLQSQIQEFVASALSGLTKGGEQSRRDEARSSGQIASTPAAPEERTVTGGPSDLGR